MNVLFCWRYEGFFSLLLKEPCLRGSCLTVVADNPLQLAMHQLLSLVDGRLLAFARQAVQHYSFFRSLLT